MRKYSVTCLIRHTKRPGNCVGLYRMSEYSDSILVNRSTLGPTIFVGCHRMSENSAVRLSKSTIFLSDCTRANFLPFHTRTFISFYTSAARGQCH